jgi:hypothetical protein
VRSVLVIVAAAGLLACSTAGPEVSPGRISQAGGVELWVRLGRAAGEGGAIVLVDGVPAHSTVLERPGLLRVRLPSLPRTGLVDVEVEFADGTSLGVPGGLEVVSPELAVRARD